MLWCMGETGDPQDGPVLILGQWLHIQSEKSRVVSGVMAGYLDKLEAKC